MYNSPILVSIWIFLIIGLIHQIMRTFLFYNHPLNVNPCQIFFWVSFSLLFCRLCVLEEKNTNEKVHEKQLAYEHECQVKETVVISMVNFRTLVHINSVKKLIHHSSKIVCAQYEQSLHWDYKIIEVLIITNPWATLFVASVLIRV